MCAPCLWLATATQNVSLEPEALRLLPTCRVWGTVLGGTWLWRLSLRAIWWCGRWGAGGVLGCAVEHAWGGIKGAHVRTRPSAEIRPPRLWHVVACGWVVDDDFDTDHLNVIVCMLRAFGSPRRHSM